MFKFEKQLFEDRHAFKSKYGGNPGFDAVFKKFIDVVRGRCKPPYNDIDWWIKRPYAEFEKFVKEFDLRNKAERKTDRYSKIAEKYGAKLLNTVDGWEIWYVPSHPAAVQLGRFYKGISTRWCISTDNPTYFNNMYKDSEFVFVIWGGPVAECPDGAFFKTALQFEYGELDIWDMADNNVEEVCEEIEPAVDWAVQNWRTAAGTTREEYNDKLVKTLISDDEWLKNNLFGLKCVVDYTKKDDGVDFRLKMSALDELLDDDSYNLVKHVLNGDDYYIVDLYSIEISYDDVIPRKTHKTFDKEFKQFGFTWNDLIKAYTSDEVFSKNVQAAVKLAKDDFFDGRSLDDTIRDCHVTGICNDAHSDIMNELYEFGITGSDYVDGVGIVLNCHFSRRMLEKAVRGCVCSGTGYDSPIAYMMYDADEESVKQTEIREPSYGWSGFDDKMMADAVDDFIERLKGRLTMQKDSPGQTYFSFDKDYLDNPRNISRKK